MTVVPVRLSPGLHDQVISVTYPRRTVGSGSRFSSLTMWPRAIDRNADLLKVISNSKLNLLYLDIDWNRNIVVLESNSKETARTRWKGNFTTAMILTDDYHFRVPFCLSVRRSLRKVIHSYEAFCKNLACACVSVKHMHKLNWKWPIEYVHHGPSFSDISRLATFFTIMLMCWQFWCGSDSCVVILSSVQRRQPCLQLKVNVVNNLSEYFLLER